MLKSMFKNKKFKAALGRAVRTVAQTAVSMITVGSMVTEVDWVTIISVSMTAGLVSILTSIAGGMPEVENEKRDGNAILQTMPDGSQQIKMEFNEEAIPGMMEKDYIRMRVKQESFLGSQE